MSRNKSRARSRQTPERCQSSRQTSERPSQPRKTVKDSASLTFGERQNRCSNVASGGSDALSALYDVMTEYGDKSTVAKKSAKQQNQKSSKATCSANILKVRQLSQTPKFRERRPSVKPELFNPIHGIKKSKAHMRKLSIFPTNFTKKRKSVRVDIQDYDDELAAEHMGHISQFSEDNQMSLRIDQPSELGSAITPSRSTVYSRPAGDHVRPATMATPGFRTSTNSGTTGSTAGTINAMSIAVVCVS